LRHANDQRILIQIIVNLGLILRFLKWLGIGLGALIVAGYGYLLAAPPELLRVGTGYSAKTICSNVFIAGRKAEDVLKIDVQAPGHPILKLVRVSVDESKGEVRTSLIGGIAPSLAIDRAGYGCTLVPSGNRADVADLPEFPPQKVPATVWREETNPKLDALLTDAALTGPGMRGIVVVKNGSIIAEKYADGFTKDTPLLGWSMTKTVNAFLVGELVKAGKLDLGATKLFDSWKADNRAKISLADLMAMHSGLVWNEGYGDVSDVTRMLFLTRDMKSLPESQIADAAPDTVFTYSSGTSMLIAELVEKAVGGNASTFAREALFNPLGITSAVIEPDASGTMSGSSFMYATARDWARLGQFMIAGGVANGQALLPAGFTQMMMTPTEPSNGRYGMGQIWIDDVDDNGKPNGLPKGSVRFSGHDGQSVTVVPSERLVIVRLGLTPSKLGWEPQPLTKAVIAALK
jgi:CubicO group peptidase (beta-lactamase class C family)